MRPPLVDWTSAEVSALTSEAAAECGRSPSDYEALEGCSGVDAANWTLSSLLADGVASPDAAVALLAARDRVVAKQIKAGQLSYPVQLFQRLHLPDASRKALAVRGGEAVVVPRLEGSGEQDFQLLVDSRLLCISAAVSRACYNISNCKRLLAILVLVRDKLLADSAALEDPKLRTRIQSRLWETLYFISIFSDSGWLCRLLHTATPPSDVAGFEHLHKGVLELLPSELRSLDEMQGSWDKDTHWFLRSIRNAGGLPRLLEIWRERGEAPQMSYEAAGLACPSGMSRELFEARVDSELSSWSSDQDVGPHRQIRHGVLQLMWHKHLSSEEVPWEAFWTCLSKAISSEPASPAALALARKNLRIVLQGRISLFGSPDMVTAQEVDAAFPPLVPLGFRLQHLLALGGWKDENGLFGEANSVAPAENCPANGCGNQGSENQRVVCKILSSEVSRSGVVNLVGTAGTGKHHLAKEVSEELMASGVWQEYHEVDLRSAITSLEAADMIASRLLTAPYGMAAHDVQLPARTRLCAWVEQQRLPYSLGFEGEDFFKARCIGLVVSHINHQLLEDEIEADKMVDILFSLMEQISQHRQVSAGRPRLRNVSLHILLCSKGQVQLESSASHPWFMKCQQVSGDSASGLRLLREGLASFAPMVEGPAGEDEAGLIDNLVSNPLALSIIGSACGCGAMTPAEALQILKRRMPPSVAMNSKAPLPPGMAGLANNRVVIPKPDDQLHAVRAGRKSYADAKITLQSPVARAIIALKAFTPEYLQTALIILSYLPAGFDLLLGTRLLASMSHPQALQPAGILDRLCRFKLVQFDADSGTFVMQASVQDAVKALLQYGALSSELATSCKEAINIILQTCGEVLTNASVLIEHGSPVAGLLLLNHHLPFFWKIQYWAQEHQLDTKSHSWLASYLKPMVEHPAVFIQHLPAGSRASLCRTMAAAAGFTGSFSGRALCLWHLSQALMEDGQLKGAADVLERAFEALESIRSNDNPEAGTWASGAPMLAVQLLKAQLYCGRAVCAARMADKTLSRDMAQKAAELQADALKKAADLEEGKSFGLDAAGPTMTVVSAAAAVRGIKQQLTASLLLSGSIEMALSEYEAAASFYEKAAKEADRDNVTSLHYAALAEHGCARARGFASDWVAALKHLEAAAKLWDRCGTYGTKTVHDWMDCSELMHALGSKKEAQQALKQAMSNVHGRYGVDVEQLATLQAQFLEADVLEHIGSPVRSGSHAELDSAAKSLGCWSPNFLMKKVTRPLKRSASTSPANSGSTTPGRNDSVAAPQKMMQRWQQSIAETNPTWGWCGVQGWPLDIWYGFALQEMHCLTGPLITRSVDVSRTFLVSEYDRILRESGPARQVRTRASRNFSRRSSSDAVPEDVKTTDSKEHAAAQDTGDSAASPTGSEQQLATAAGAVGPARRRRPAGRAASGSLAHAKKGGANSLDTTVAMIAKQSSQPGDVVLPKINTLAKGVPNSSQGTETIREDDEDLF